MSRSTHSVLVAVLLAAVLPTHCNAGICCSRPRTQDHVHAVTVHDNVDQVDDDVTLHHLTSMHLDMTESLLHIHELQLQSHQTILDKLSDDILLKIAAGIKSPCC